MLRATAAVLPGTSQADGAGGWCCVRSYLRWIEQLADESSRPQARTCSRARALRGPRPATNCSVDAIQGLLAARLMSTPTCACHWTAQKAAHQRTANARLHAGADAAARLWSPVDRDCRCVQCLAANSLQACRTQCHCCIKCHKLRIFLQVLQGGHLVDDGDQGLLHDLEQLLLREGTLQRVQRQRQHLAPLACGKAAAGASQTCAVLDLHPVTIAATLATCCWTERQHPTPARTCRIWCRSAC